MSNEQTKPHKKSLLYRIFHLNDPQEELADDSQNTSIMARSRRHYDSESDGESDSEHVADHVHELERSKDFSSFPRLFRRPSSANLNEVGRQKSMHEKFKKMTQESQPEEEEPPKQRRPSAHFKDFFRLRGANASSERLDHHEASTHIHHKSPLASQLRCSSSESSFNLPADRIGETSGQIVDHSPFKPNEETMFLSPHYSPNYTDSSGRPSTSHPDHANQLNLSDQLVSTPPRPIDARRHSSHSFGGDYLTPEHSPTNTLIHPEKASPNRRFFSLSRVGSTHSLSSQAKLARSNSEISLTEKYGKTESVIGKGGQAVVKLCCPVGSDKKYAVKEFRARRKDEGKKEYVKKLIAEFCISSSLTHENVIQTLDLIQDERHQWCVVMEYMPGGDLWSRIHSGTLTDANEINCYFKQMVAGVKYLHEMGVAHRDLKPENLLIDETGRNLKITDFGISSVFRSPFNSTTLKTSGKCGSGPYKSPEMFADGEYDAQMVDIWSMAIIYYVMVYSHHLWRSATADDPRYKAYLENYKRYSQLDRLLPAVRVLLYEMLNPNPVERIRMDGIYENEWFQGICVCLHASEVDHSHPIPKAPKIRS